MIRSINTISEHKAQIGGVASGGYILTPDGSKPQLVESLKEVAFLDTSFSWAAALEVAAGAYLISLVIWQAYKGIKWVKGAYGRHIKKYKQA